MKIHHNLFYACLLGITFAACRDQISVPPSGGRTSNSITEGIVFTHTGSGNNLISTFDSNGREVVLFTNGTVADALPNGTMLWSVGSLPDSTGHADMMPGLLVADSTGVYHTVTASFISQPGPVLSPDGKLVAYTVEIGTLPNVIRHIHVVNIDGTADHDVYAGVDYSSEMQFSPDGSRLAFFGLPVTGNTDTLSMIDFRRMTPKLEIIPIATAERPYGILSMQWSSKDDLAYRDGNSVRVNSPAGGYVNVYVDEGSPVGWSPDGTTLAYAHANPPGPQFELYLTSDFGKTKTELTNTTMFNEEDAHWSPDGTKILSTGFPVGSTTMDWSLEEIDVQTKSIQVLGKNGVGFGYFTKLSKSYH